MSRRPWRHASRRAPGTQGLRSHPSTDSPPPAPTPTAPHCPPGDLSSAGKRGLMAAFLLSLGLFTFWAVLGYAVVAALRPRLRVVPNLLLSPAVGIALTELPLYLLNRAGLPILQVGGPVAVALLLVVAL